MNTLEKALTDYASSEFDRLLAAHPDEASNLHQLRDYVLNGLAENVGNLADLSDFVCSIQNHGGDLDVDGFVYSELWDLEDALQKRIRELVPLRSNQFPEVSVSLGLATKSGTSKSSGQKNTGQRTKLGGVPDWIQGEETPMCGACSVPMTFVGQIDSIGSADTKLGHALAAKEAFVFSDAGMIYVFWCKGCNATQSVLQFN